MPMTDCDRSTGEKEWADYTEASGQPWCALASVALFNCRHISSPSGICRSIWGWKKAPPFIWPVARLQALLCAASCILLVWLFYRIFCKLTCLDTVMSRMYNQTGDLYKGVFDCLYKTVRTEGLFAIYKGFFAHLARILPHTVSNADPTVTTANILRF